MEAKYSTHANNSTCNCINIWLPCEPMSGWLALEFFLSFSCRCNFYTLDKIHSLPSIEVLVRGASQGRMWEDRKLSEWWVGWIQVQRAQGKVTIEPSDELFHPQIQCIHCAAVLYHGHSKSDLQVNLTGRIGMNKGFLLYPILFHNSIELLQNTLDRLFGTGQRMA